MIEKLSQSDDRAFGIRVEGEVTADEFEEFLPQMEASIDGGKKRKIGLLFDLSSVKHVDLKTRWAELRFFRRYAEHIERVGVVGGGPWEQLLTEIAQGTVLLSVDTRYFEMDELPHAWHWVRHGEHHPDVPVRRIFPSKDGLMGGYDPEYLDV